MFLWDIFFNIMYPPFRRIPCTYFVEHIFHCCAHRECSCFREPDGGLKSAAYSQICGNIKEFCVSKVKYLWDIRRNSSYASIPGIVCKYQNKDIHVLSRNYGGWPAGKTWSIRCYFRIIYWNNIRLGRRILDLLFDDQSINK